MVVALETNVQEKEVPTNFVVKKDFIFYEVSIVSRVKNTRIVKDSSMEAWGIAFVED